MTEPSKQKVDTRIVVETPEGVDFEFVIAGPGKRCLAFVIDWLIKVCVVAAALFGMSFFLALGEAAAGLGFGFWLTLWFAMDWFYHSFFETWWSGQTPGKRSQLLRVVRSNGTPITATSAIGRNFLLAADCQPALGVGLYTTGLLAMLCNRRMQRVGDLVFDTMVIDESRDYISRAAGLTLGIEPIARSECRGRFHVPERTLAVIERLFEGDRIVSDGRREEIARPLSTVLRQRLGYEDPLPDPRNPHVFFEQVPNRHSVFLRRVLKTFADEESAATGSAAATSGQKKRVRPMADPTATTANATFSHVMDSSAVNHDSSLRSTPL